MTDDLVSLVRDGDRRAVGRLCRLLEDGRNEELTRGLYSAPGVMPWRIGVTGSPGVGKSTLVSALVSELRTRYSQVGVIAVDPSSPFSGGAILGDRIRMQQHAADDGVFIRSVANRGTLGGLARATADLAEVMRVWGASVVVIETVGAGQAEHDVMLFADTTLVVMAPGLGDELQANKAGIMEVADVFAVNKADLPGAARMVSAIEGAISLTGDSASATSRTGHHASTHARPDELGDGSRPTVVQTIATKREGFEALLASLERHRAWLFSEAGSARRSERRGRAAQRRIEAAILQQVLARVSNELHVHQSQVANGEEDPTSAALQLLRCFCDITHEG